MKLRKLARLCEHDELKPHVYFMDVPIPHDCPGGVFLPDDTLVIPEPIVRPLGTPLTYAGVRDVWDTYVKPDQEAQIPPSTEMRCLMAILRAVAQGYVDAGQGPTLLTVRETE